MASRVSKSYLQRCMAGQRKAKNMIEKERVQSLLKPAVQMEVALAYGSENNR